MKASGDHFGQLLMMPVLRLSPPQVPGLPPIPGLLQWLQQFPGLQGTAITAPQMNVPSPANPAPATPPTGNVMAPQSVLPSWPLDAHMPEEMKKIARSILENEMNPDRLVS